MFRSSIPTALKLSRTCRSLTGILSIKSTPSFHRQLSTVTPHSIASKRFYQSSFTFQFALASTKPTTQGVSSSLRHSTSSTIASQRSKAIARHLTTAASFPPPLPTMSYGKQPTDFQTRKIGALHTTDFRCYIEGKDGTPLSPFHDVPLYANEQQNVLNMVVEIPRWTNAKLEVGLLYAK